MHLCVHLLILQLFKSCICAWNSTSSFFIGSNNLTQRHTQLAVGYDSSIDAILLFGGYNYPQHFTLFQKGNFLWGGTYFLFANTTSVSQHYTQLHHELWMIRFHGDGFIAVNTKTHVVRDPLITIPTNVHYGACLTSTEDHLIVIGSSQPPTNIVQIYSIHDGVWLGHVPSLNDERSALSCAVVSDKVYAIGGWGHHPTAYYHTIEVFDISAIVDESFTPWYYFSGSLRTGRRETRSVVYGAYIYVIGGVDEGGQYPKDINMVNTVTGECNVVHYLAYGVANGAPIVTGNTLYVFGGYNHKISEKRYQYITLPTLYMITKNDTTDEGEWESEDMPMEWGMDVTITSALVGSVVLFICFGLCLANEKMKKSEACKVAKAALKSQTLHQQTAPVQSICLEPIQIPRSPSKRKSAPKPPRAVDISNEEDDSPSGDCVVRETLTSSELIFVQLLGRGFDGGFDGGFNRGFVGDLERSSTFTFTKSRSLTRRDIRYARRNQASHSQQEVALHEEAQLIHIEHNEEKLSPTDATREGALPKQPNTTPPQKELPHLPMKKIIPRNVLQENNQNIILNVAEPHNIYNRRNVLAGIQAFSKTKSLNHIDADSLKKEAAAAPPSAKDLLQFTLKNYRQFVMDDEDDTDNDNGSSGSWDD